MHNAIIPYAKTAVGVIGGIAAYFEPAIPFGIICTVAVLFDCLSAYMLCRRVHRRHLGRQASAAAYFTSAKMKNVFATLLRIYSLIVLAFLVDAYIFTFVDMYLANIVAGAFCFCQIWSILENESSENDATWAKLLQKIMIDKASRHLDIDLSDLRHGNTTEQHNHDDETPTNGNGKEAPHGTDY